MLVEVQIQGITPLMCDRFTNDLLLKGPKSVNGAEDLPPIEQAKAKLYVDDSGRSVFPADNLMACIVDAGRFIKIGKRQLSTRDTTIVTSFLSIIEPYFPIKSEHGWRVDARGVVNQATKGRHVAYRPMFDDWSFSLTLDIDTKQQSLVTARELVDRAGRNVGVGVMRPARKGRYGQFKVTHWTERK